MRRRTVLLLLSLPCLYSQGESWQRQFTKGDGLLDAGDPVAARTELERALKLAEKLPPDTRLGATLDRLAQAEFLLGQYRRSAGHFARSLQIWDNEPAGDGQKRGAARANLAQACAALGEYARAETLFRQVLTEAHRAGWDESPHAAAIRTGLAETLYLQRRYVEAETEQRKALATWGAAGHPENYVALNNLALIAIARDHEGEALPLLERAARLGEDRPITDVRQARVLGNLATLYRRAGRYTEAEALFQRVLPAMERNVGPDHPDVANVLDEFAELLKKTGRGRQARQFRSRAQNIQSASVGETNRSGITVNWRDLKDQK